MNDRVSSKPPTTYIGEEEYLERYEHENETRGRRMTRPKTFMHHSDESIIGSSADRSEVSRHSSIFRFGKSLAASFNPSNWKIFSKAPEETGESIEQKTLRERREKAEAMYQELKKAGQFRDSAFGPSLFQHPEGKEPMPTKHDSGVEFGERRSRSISRNIPISRETSREEKRKGRIFLEPPQLPTAGSESHFSQSPASAKGTQESARKGKFHFKKPSLSNIRKSGSDNGSNAEDNHQARRVPSRKDLQKQQKLVKRVSDLEGKLEAARRHLAEALDEPVPSGPPPRRPRFVPGAMPSLPSERLLSGYCNTGAGMSESVSISQIGKAVTLDSPMTFAESLDEEQLHLDPPSRRAPLPPNFDKSLPQESDSPVHNRVMKSIEIEEEESLDIEEPATETEQPTVQAVKILQANVDQQSTALVSHLSDEDNSTDLSDQDSDFELSESGKQATSPEPSEISKLTAAKPGSNRASKPQSSRQQVSKSKKRKSMNDYDSEAAKTFKPVAESDSDLSSVKPKRTPKKIASGNTSRKLRKTGKTSPPNRGPSYRHQLKPGKKQSFVSSQSSLSKIPVKGRQSVSPPPSGQFTGLEYTKPSSQSSQNGKVGEPRMATYSAIPSADGDDVPPMPKLPKAVRLASGEVVKIPQNGKISGGNGANLQHTGSHTSKLTKARPTPSPKKGDERKSTNPKKDGEQKKDFEWPDDVF